MDAVNERTHEAGAWLSLEASLAQARPLRAWSARQQGAVCDAFQAAYGAWCEAWGLPAAEVRVTEPQAVSGALDDATAAQALRGWMFGETAPSAAPDGPDMAGELASCAWDALQAALDAIATTEPASTRPVAAWSGAVALLFPWQARTWCRVLDGDAVQAILAQRGWLAGQGGSQAQPAAVPAPPAPIDRALAEHAVEVRVHLHPVTLTLGQLQSLAPGDVVTLDHPLQAPALVHLAPTADGGTAVPLASPLCTAWLGRAGDHLAVELHAEA